MGALDGVRILDLSRILAGPWATQMLADLGADVVKIEADWGDDTRKWGPPFIGEDAAYFHACNRGKRSMVLDLKSKEGMETLRQLIGCADVVVENFRTGTLERLGIDTDTFGDKILCRITGYGQTGPRATEPGYDIALQAMSGIMSVTGSADGEPAKVGVAWIDVLTGMMAGNGILAALFHRERTGEGQTIDLSLFDVALMAMVNQAQNWIASGSDPTRMGHAHPNIVPYQAFLAKDDWFILACGNDAQFLSVCKATGATQLQRAEFADNAGRLAARTEIIDTLSEIISQHSVEYWISVFSKHGVPCTPILSVSQAFSDQQALARNALWNIGGQDSVANALRFMSKTPAKPGLSPPKLGEHTAEVISEWLGDVQ
jgi:crotonobetainyl-CoA:carnitine CoA-transferase CaiB-like acyl-CoA transferase